jgi:hypothetical protein
MALLVKNFAFLPGLRLLATRFALSTLLVAAATAGSGLALHLVLTARFGVVGAVASLGGTYLLSLAVSEFLARFAYPVRIPWGALAARFVLVGAAAAAATLLALRGRGLETAALQVAAFAVCATPIAIHYWRSRALFGRTR